MSEPLPLTLYGADDCDDTEHTLDRLRARRIPFREISIDHDPAAEQFVIFINNGYRSTPTLVFGAGQWKIVLTEPTDEQLVQALRQAGYALAD
jgi:mycoredoxin